MDVIVTDENLAVAAAVKNSSGSSFHPETTGGSKPAPKADTTVARILKLIPGEVAAGYTALLAIAASAVSDGTVKYAAPSAIVICSVLIVMWIRAAGDARKPPIKPHPTQYVFSVLAFVAWAFSIRNPLDGFGVIVPTWIPAFAIVLIPIFGGLLLRDRPPQPRKLD